MEVKKCKAKKGKEEVLAFVGQVNDDVEMYAVKVKKKKEKSVSVLKLFLLPMKNLKKLLGLTEQ